MSTNKEEPARPDFLRPLQKRTRTESVTAQIGEMSRLPKTIVLRRAAAKDTNRLELETLIALGRAYQQAGDQPAAEAVWGGLINRLRGRIRAKVFSWAAVASIDREDAENDAVLRLLQYVSNLSPSEEMWECNFTHCFTQRMSTILSALTRRKQPPTVSLTAENDEGDTGDGLANLPDARAEAEFTNIEVRETVAALSRDHPQFGTYLFMAREGFTDTEIASYLNVTTRTLRNWKDKARQMLSPE